MVKNSEIFQKLIGREEDESTELFRDNFLFSSDNYGYIKVSAKERANAVGARHSSSLLIDRAMGEDSSKVAKIGVKFTEADINSVNNNCVVKASTEISDSKIWRTKFFARVLRDLTPSLYAAASISAGFSKDLKEKPLRVNDTFYLQNLKGVRNLGYFYDPEDKKKALGGDILGVDRYASLQLKLAQKDCPLLSEQSIDPFIHASLAAAPTRNPVQTWKDYLRASCGMGLSMRTSLCTIEVYYNLHVHRQRNELASDFQINFGLD